jgi:hypothetical protein
MKTYLPKDTSLEALKVQHDALRRRGPDWRLQQAFLMSNSMRAISVEGVRARHPEYSEEQITLAVARILLGDELFRKAYPNVDILP